MAHRRNSGQGGPAGHRQRSQLEASTFASHVRNLDMTQPQNMINSPGAGSTVNNYYTVNNMGPGVSGGGNSPRTNPHYDVQDRSSRADHEIYSDQLLTKKRGFPLWSPGPAMQLPIEYRRRGISIGDVGIISPGRPFDFLFNIFEPADGQVNSGEVPQRFSPLSRQGLEREIQRNVDYGPHTHLASSSVRKLRMNWSSDTSVDQSFESSARESAILIMPDGATTWNLLNTRELRNVITRNARDWYTYVWNDRGRDARNGDIRVVVGVDKVATWGIATSACSAGQRASYVFKHDPAQLYQYRWDCIGGSGRVGPQREETQELMQTNVVPQNQTVFVRTLNFSFSGKVWNSLPSESIGQCLSGSGELGYRGPPSGSGNRGGPRGRNGSWGSNTTASSHQSGSMPGSFNSAESVKFDIAELGVHHPSAALHEYLHEKYPDQEIVITDDKDWISVLNDDEVFPEPEELRARVLDVHQIQVESGVVQLVRKTDALLLPSNVENCDGTTLVPGEADDLGIVRTHFEKGKSEISPPVVDAGNKQPEKLGVFDPPKSDKTPGKFLKSLFSKLTKRQTLDSVRGHLTGQAGTDDATTRDVDKNSDTKRRSLGSLEGRKSLDRFQLPPSWDVSPPVKSADMLLVNREVESPVTSPWDVINPPTKQSGLLITFRLGLSTLTLTHKSLRRWPLQIQLDTKPTLDDFYSRLYEHLNESLTAPELNHYNKFDNVHQAFSRRCRERKLGLKEEPIRRLDCLGSARHFHGILRTQSPETWELVFDQQSPSKRPLLMTTA